jgi:tetratricopeptide (TPR) repeat protein
MNQQMLQSKNNIINSELHAGRDIRIGDDYITYNNYFAAQEVKIPHRLTNNIPTNADHILGRATELAQAHDHLAQHQATILFNGIGGIGKTALASKYMAVYGSDYKHLAWITVQSTLAEAFTNNAPLLASLQITQQVQDYIAAKQLDKAFEYLFHQLNLLEHTLVVIDNANDLDDLDQYKNLFDGAVCHFLITSRNKPTEWATVAVDTLTEVEAVTLFRRLFPSVEATDEAIKNLLSKLFYHTLLIELVAKACAYGGIAFEDLVGMIDEEFIHHKDLNEDIVPPKGQHGNFMTVESRKAKIEDYIGIIFSQVKALDTSYKHLLKAMALLPVATPFDLVFLKDHFAFFDINDSALILSDLTANGWLQKEQSEGHKPYYKLHPLIADVVVKHLEVEALFADNYIIKIDNLIHYDNTDPNDNLFNKKQYEFFAERLARLFFNVQNISISKLINSLRVYYFTFGFYQKSLYYGIQALKIAENLPLKDTSIISYYQYALAIVYRNLGNHAEAAYLLEKSLEIALEKLGKEDTQISASQSALADIYRVVGRNEEAAILLKKAIKSDIKNYGRNHQVLAVHYSNLALVFQNLGKYSKAADLLEKSLKNVLTVLGENHFHVIIYQSNLASVYLNLENFEKAAMLLEEAILNSKKYFGEEHPSLVTRQYNLAFAYQKLMREVEAQDLYQKAYQLSIKVWGEYHTNTQKVKKMIN